MERKIGSDELQNITYGLAWPDFIWPFFIPSRLNNAITIFICFSFYRILLKRQFSFRSAHEGNMNEINLQRDTRHVTLYTRS